MRGVGDSVGAMSTAAVAFPVREVQFAAETILLCLRYQNVFRTTRSK